MTKIEELKALLEEEKESLNEYNSACKANDDVEDVKSFRLSHQLAKKYRLGLSEELLPSLIAVAEAAQKVCCHDFSVSDLDGDLMLDMRHLETALEPLTKDTDK